MHRRASLPFLVISLVIAIACGRLILMRPTADDWEPDVAPATRVVGA